MFMLGVRFDVFGLEFNIFFYSNYVYVFFKNIIKLCVSDCKYGRLSIYFYNI